MQLAGEQRRNLGRLAVARHIDEELPKIESNLMAVRLGNPARCSDQNALLRTWFTLILALHLDPAGVLLLLAATRR